MDCIEKTERIIRILKEYGESLQFNIVLENKNNDCKLRIHYGEYDVETFGFGVCSDDEIKEMKNLLTDFVEKSTKYYLINDFYLEHTNHSFTYVEDKFSYDKGNYTIMIISE